ncbi:hypothetical protein PUNSTDRAFT_144658 [Punctularia strigosozonata HHB-11173 SS5]|uniref:uncharacterized protein n=1 Tax=Punctularia strigosozonata (strain HHB-11173) TaxID=741275 RepID=UPI0004416430|nr:uncharacterized protein PUNSTDRAFT_144658 [Punctularia strigosozonata HHB-11173 SS5]EIN07102.1 hypothetical protein PUNSTDRAFT_144658 [Punctularia strigosozonata HHB-11173 SS5]
MDFYWLRLEGLYHEHVFQPDTYDPPHLPGVFNRGDIAHISGGIRQAIWENLERLGPLTPYERDLARDAAVHSVGKYCVVLEHLSGNSYRVAYLASFGRAQDASTINPGLRWCMLAFAGGEPWPQGFPPVSTSPRWPVNCFLLALPVVRSDLEEPSHLRGRPWLYHRRERVPEGELRRVEQMMMDRQKRLRKPGVAQQLRDTIVRMSRKRLSIDEDEDMNADLELGKGDTTAYQAFLTTTSEKDAVNDLSASAEDMDPTVYQRALRLPPRFRRRLLPVFPHAPSTSDRNEIPLDVSEYSDVSYLLQNASRSACLSHGYYIPPSSFSPAFVPLTYIPGTRDLANAPRLVDERQDTTSYVPEFMTETGSELVFRGVLPSALMKQSHVASSARSFGKARNVPHPNFTLVDYREPANPQPKKGLKRILAQRARAEWLAKRAHARKEAELARAERLAKRADAQKEAERARIAVVLAEAKAREETAKHDPDVDVDIELDVSFGTDSLAANPEYRRALERLAKATFKAETARLMAGDTGEIESSEPQSMKVAVDGQLHGPKPELTFVLVDYVPPPEREHKWFSKAPSPSSTKKNKIESDLKTDVKAPVIWSASFVPPSLSIRPSIASPRAPGFRFGPASETASFVLLQYKGPDPHPLKRFCRRARSKPATSAPKPKSPPAPSPPKKKKPPLTYYQTAKQAAIQDIERAKVDHERERKKDKKNGASPTQPLSAKSRKIGPTGSGHISILETASCPDLGNQGLRIWLITITSSIAA